MRAIARDPRILDAVAELYGEPACLFKDKLIFKPPGAKGYALHQDYISWKTFPTSFVTVVVAIDPSDANNGATEVFSGFHRRGCMSPLDGMYHELAAETVAASPGVMLDLAPGDIGIFSGYTPHRSEPNRSSQSRRLLYLSYNALSDGGEQREKHYAEFHQWLKDRYAEYGKVNTFFAERRPAAMPPAANIVKFHVSLNAADLAQSVNYYRNLFGVEPARQTSDYAKFEIDEPPLVLSLIPGPQIACGALNHLGIRLRDFESMIAMQARLETAGIKTNREDGVNAATRSRPSFG